MAKERWEEEAAERLIAFLTATRHETYGIVGRDVPVASGENFDFQIESHGGEKLAVEMYRLVTSEAEMATLAMWGRVVHLLQEELGRRGVSGYAVSTPVRFDVRRADLMAFATNLADAIKEAIERHPNDPEFEEQGLSFRKAPELPGVVFFGTDAAHFVDPGGVAARSLNQKLAEKNGQLAVDGHERILLIVNAALFVDADDVGRVLALLDADVFSNIDKIIFEVRPGVHEVVFDRDVTIAERGGVLPETPAGRLLLARQLGHRLAEGDVNAFDFVKTATDRIGGIAWLEDVQARENLVGLGEKLVAQGRVDDAAWIVRTLRNDPDPGLDSSLHQGLLKGADARIITSVRGRLCWLMAEIIATNQPRYYTLLIDIIEDYLLGENLYVRVQAAVPLEALMARTRARKRQDGSAFDWADEERARVRRIATEAIRANAGHARVVQALLRAFNQPRDLNEEEAHLLLTVGLETRHADVLHDLASYLVWYALFRHRGFPDAGVFDRSRFVELLREQVATGELATKSSLMWHFWKILETDQLPYEDLQEFIDIWLAQPFEARTEQSFGLLFKEIARRKGDEAIRIAMREAERIERYLEGGGSPDIWIPWLDDILPLFADRPDELMRMATQLARLWHKGVFVGEVTNLARSYRFIRDPAKKAEVRRHLRAVYEAMRAVAPRLPPLEENGSPSPSR